MVGQAERAVEADFADESVEVFVESGAGLGEEVG